MEEQCSAEAEGWLARNTRWQAPQRNALAALAPGLLEHLPGRAPWLLALGGPPGSGKTTLARLLAHLAEKFPPRGEGETPRAAESRDHQAPASVVVLSLDDYYLPLAARRALAREVHPLLLQRGVPGTHDVNRLFDHIDHLLDGRPEPLAVPVFDKGADDRRQEARRLTGLAQPVSVILEGWFLGLTPEPHTALARDRTSVEEREDRDGRWRRYVNDALGDFDRRLRARATACWQLITPGWEEVLAWRWTQEQDLPPDRRRLHGPGDVAEFLGTFERLGRRLLDLDGAGMDLVLRLDSDHRPHLESRP